jgi:hypothetical protein
MQKDFQASGKALCLAEADAENYRLNAALADIVHVVLHCSHLDNASTAF